MIYNAASYNTNNVDNSRFEGCTQLHYLEIGNNVQNIPQNLFYNLTYLTSIRVKAVTPPTVGSDAFYNVSRSIPLYIPCESGTSYMVANTWITFTNQVQSFPYEVNVYPNDAAMGSAAVTQLPSCSSNTAVIQATANTGYSFDRWSDNNTQNPRTLTVTSDVSLTAQFIPGVYTVTVNSNNSSWGSVSGGGQYNYNTNATLTATPTTHHHFVRWNDANTTNPRTVTVTDDITYTAYFATDTHTVTATSANTAMGTVTGGGQYEYGSTATLTAVPATGHSFLRWSDGNTQNPRTVTVNGDATYTAQFSVNSYTVSVLSGNSAWGSVAGGGTFQYGTEIQISATAVSGYHFTAWSDGNHDNPRTVTVECDAVYTAFFAEDVQCTVTVVSSDESRGYVTGGGVYVSGQQATFSATAYEHYVFSHWSDGNTQNPRTVTVLDNVTYTAYFSGVQHTVSVYSSDDNMGSVSGGGVYEYGSTVTVTATPGSGYRFVRWSNGSEENPYTFTVFGDVNLIAQFESNGATGIDEAGFNSYNISVDRGTVIVSGAAKQEICILDVMGRTVYSTASYDGRAIALPASGVYLVRIGGEAAKKILIVK